MGKLNIALGMISILYPSAQADAIARANAPLPRTGRGHWSLFTVNCSLNEQLTFDVDRIGSHTLRLLFR